MTDRARDLDPLLLIRPLLLAVGVLLAMVGTGAAQDRTALVIGVGRYENGPALANAEADAAAIARAFAARGFRTELILNPKRADLMRALALFRLESKGAELAVIWFSGHGVWSGTGQLLLPSDARFEPERLERSSVALGVLVRAIADRPRQKLIFVDACREVPGLAPPAGATLQTEGQAGLRIEFASQPGAPAFDGAGVNGPFAAAWLQILRDGPVDMDAASRKARLDVIRATGGQQIPWSRSSLLRPLLLFEAPKPTG